jgi:hypothetical protein
MKKFLFLSVFSCLFSIGFTQTKVHLISHYLFPEFSKGIVLMKTGVKNEALLNYNSLTEEMIFDDKGKKLALTQLELIDTAYIGGRKFVPLNDKFIELIYHSKYTLYAENRCNLEDPGKPSGYGGTSQTSATASYSTLISQGQAHELILPEGYKTKPFIEYWLKTNGEMKKFANIRQLTKLFDDKEDLCKEYIKKHNVKYEDQKSLVELIRFLEAN